MPIRFLCQHCRKRNSISSKMAGKTVKCPRCGEETLVAADDDVSTANASANLGSPSVAAPVPERTANPFAKAAFDAFRTAEEKLADEEPRQKVAGDEDDDDPSAVARVGSAFALPKSHVPPPIPAKLEIRDPDGNVSVRELSKSQPVLFGRHMTNDVVIDEEGVASLHGRISWNGSAFELTAAGKDGIEINGTLVKQRTLEDDDVIRIGSYDIAFVVEESSAPIKKPSTASGLALKRADPAEPPLDVDDQHDELDQIERRRQSGGSEAERKRGSQTVKTDDPPNRDFDDFEGAPPTSELTMAELIDEATADEFPETSGEDFDSVDQLPGEEVEPEEEGPVTSLRSVFSKNERLKEQTVMRSPFVLALAGGAGLMTIVALVFWFLTEREQIQRQFSEAEREVKAAQFATGITKFEEFIKAHPNHALTDGADGAKAQMGKAKIEKELIGSPAFANALKALQDFIVEHRDAKYFPDLHDDLVGFAKKIALDAPKAAKVNKQAELLEISKSAVELMKRYSPPDSPPTEAEKEIEIARDEAIAAIDKAKAIDNALESIKQSLKKEPPSPFEVVVTRQELIVRYRDLAKETRLDAALRKALELAKKQTVREELQRDALTDDPAKLLPKPLTLAVRTRALSDEQSANRVVFALGQDSSFAVDSITGDPLWRRTVGVGTPFFPMAVETSRSGVLLFDTNQNQLMLLDRRTGELAWRQVIEPAAGPPLVVEGQIYLATQSGYLYRIDADSGRITSRLKFPQRLFAPPLAMADGQHILVIGDSEFAYTLGLNPLECQLVTQIGHQAGTIEAAPLMMGQHVLIAENDRNTTSRLRVLNASKAEQRLSDVAETRVEGHIRDDMILRGNRLYTISSGPRLSVFNVSDDQNQRTLAPVSTLQIPTSHSGAAHIAAGADDQIWLAIGALRKVLLKTDVLQLDPVAIAVGQSTQPMQMIGRNLYVGRQLPVGQAVHLTQADGESMQSNWKTVVGANILAVNFGTDGQIVCVTDGADTFLLSANEVFNGGFRPRSEQQLKLPDNATQPLQAAALAEGRTAVWTNGPDGKLWVIGPSALPQAEVALAQTLDCPPLRFAGGVLLPIPGRLKLAGRTGGPACDDFLAPVNRVDDGPVRKWKHLVAIDADTLFVLDSLGKMSKLQYRTGEKTFFQTVSSIDFPQPIDVAPTLHNGRLITADAAGTMRVLDVTTTETRAEVALGGPASKPLWVAEPLLLAEVGRQKLVAFDAALPKQPLWNLPLEGGGLVGSPLLIGNVLIAVQQSGDVLRIDAKTGVVEKKLVLGHVATHGPLRLGNLLVVLTADGSLLRVESLVPEMAADVKPEPAKPEPAKPEPAKPKPTEDKPADSAANN
ncbi:MAG: PQQ-binding-like beta-propeller repeat protein [Planctomycetaceae bacterium]